LKDSNPNVSTGFTSIFNVQAGQNKNDIDAGIHQQQNTSGSIGNFVFNDVNNNGIQDQNERGIQDVTVTLYDELGINVIKTIITDVLGNYTFNDLPAGNYVVGFSNITNGYALVTPGQGNNNAMDSDPDQATGKTGVITLLAGQVNTTIDAGLYNQSLPKGAIGNYVWFDRNKNGIQDVTENGVAGVTINLFNNNDIMVATTITNNEGFYIFNGLAASNYYVNFTNLPFNHKLTISNEGNDDLLDSDPEISTNNTAMITLGVDEVNLTIDAGIVSNTGRNNKGSIGDKVWNDANQNGVQDVEELGVQGVTVTLYQNNGISVIATTTTNALGEYIFTNLDPGNYVVGFTNLPSGFTYSTPDLGSDDELDSDAIPANGGKTDPVFLDEGDIVLTVDAGIYQNATLASIGDYVWNDVNRDGIQDNNEPGMPGITVKLINANNEVVANTTTDGNGAYQFTGLVAGNYAVEFSNLPQSYSFTTQNNTNDNLDSDVDTLTGRTATIVLVSGQNITTIDAGIYTLKSSLGNYVWEDINNNGVQDFDEPGISGIAVTLYDANDNPITMAITNSRGAYNFVNLELGSYSVGFSNKPVAGTWSPSNSVSTNDSLDSDADQLTGKTALVTLVAGEYNPTVDAGIHLPTGAGLGDYVWLDLNADGTQSPNEPGVPGVTVTLYDANDNALRTTITDQNGAYTFSNLIPGTFKVGFSTLPVYYQPNGKQYQSSFTLTNLGSDSTDNDVDPGTGKTGTYVIAIGQYNPTVDAGIKLDFVLPALDLKAFATKDENNWVNVSWKTDYESNTSHFEIERSLDAISFEKVATKAASGTTIGTRNYAIKDDISAVQRKEIIYYRIKMIDLDGKSMYSNVVNVKTIETDAEIMVYPSPFTSNVNVIYQTDNATTLSIRVTDLNGNVVSSKFTEVTAGKNIITFENLSSLSTGIYMIMVSDTENGVNNFFKVTKQ
jgi:protocatechuate 3,4-dioxygenase beta subunit